MTALLVLANWGAAIGQHGCGEWWLWCSWVKADDEASVAATKSWGTCLPIRPTTPEPRGTSISNTRNHYRHTNRQTCQPYSRFSRVKGEFESEIRGPTNNNQDGRRIDRQHLLNVRAHAFSRDAIDSELAVICLKWNARNFRLAEEIRTTKAWINNAILLWTVHQSEHRHPRAQVHVQPHTHTLSMDSQPLYMESSNHREVRMICKCFIFAGRKFEREAQKVNN